jgi:hypothetical protein
MDLKSLMYREMFVYSFSTETVKFKFQLAIVWTSITIGCKLHFVIL